jgi:toxin ParE1/3/4
VSRYLLSPAAQIDLEQIWDYSCHRWGVEQADEYLRELQRAIERAGANPRIGRACDEIRPGYRKLAAGSHTLCDGVTNAQNATIPFFCSLRTQARYLQPQFVISTAPADSIEKGSRTNKP